MKNCLFACQTLKTKLIMKNNLPLSVIKWAAHFRPDFLNNPKIRKYFIFFSFIIFSLGIILSVWAQPQHFSEINVWPCFIIFFLFVPCTHTLNVWELKLHAALCKKNLSFVDAFETIIIAKAANFLPFPGAAAIRISRLRALDISWKNSSYLTLCSAFIWLGISLFISGIMLYLKTKIIFIGICALFTGTIITIVSLYTLFSLYSHFYFTIILLLIKLSTLLVSACRLTLSFLTINFTVEYSDALILSSAKAMSSIFFFLPSNIGIAEGLTAGLSYLLLDINAGISFIAATVNLILGALLSAFLSIFILLKHKENHDLQK